MNSLRRFLKDNTVKVENRMCKKLIRINQRKEPTKKSALGNSTNSYLLSWLCHKTTIKTAKKSDWKPMVFSRFLVGVRWFEHPTSSSRTKRSTKLSHTPKCKIFNFWWISVCGMLCGHFVFWSAFQNFWNAKIPIVSRLMAVFEFWSNHQDCVFPNEALYQTEPHPEIDIKF